MVLAQATVGWAGHECQNGSSEQKKAIKDAQEHVENSLQGEMPHTLSDYMKICADIALLKPTRKSTMPPACANV